MTVRLYFFIFISIIFSSTGIAQEKDSIRISGILISADSMQQIPRAVIRRNDVLSGYSADTAGYFSIFAYPADTITFSSIGYKEGKFVVPKGLNSSSYSLVESLIPDSLDGNTLEFYPLPTAEEFVDSFRNLSLMYTDKYEVMRENIEEIDEMEDEALFLSKYQPMDINFGYGRLYNNPYGLVPGNNFLNPAQWSRFLKDLQELNLGSDELE